MGVDPQAAKEQLADLREKAVRSARRRPATKLERRWLIATRVNFVVDMVASVYFLYLVRSVTPVCVTPACTSSTWCA